ncbi:MAG: aminotransferase-like domain-containing protein [Gemmobacter sp.]
MRPAFAPWLATTNDITAGFLSAGPEVVNMAGGLPAPETFPAEELADIAAATVRDDPGAALAYSPVTGLPALRDLLAARFSTGALRLTRDNVLVTTAGMQGLDLIGKALLTSGQVIAAQWPTYLGAIDAWRPHAPTYRSFAPEDNAVDPEALLAGAQFGYMVPNFSNPTGRLVGAGFRQRMVAAAQATGTWLVEDDPYGTLQYDGDRLPRMIELAADGGPYQGPVVYMGTLSKEIVPGLRIGWMIAAPAMIRALAAAKQGSDMCTSGLTQGIALRALQAGLMERVQPGVIALYRARRDALCDAMERHLSPWFEWERPVGGMFVWAVARDPAFDTDRLLALAMAAGVSVTPSSVFDPAGVYRRAIRINFTLNPPDRLAEGVRRLAVAAGRMTEAAA